MPPASRKCRHETGKTVPEGVRRDHPGCGGTIEAGTFEDPRFSFEFLEPETFIPAGGQGIIAVEAKKGSEVLKILEKLNDKEAERALFAERKVLRLLGAGCTAAVGVYAKEENGAFRMDLMRETKSGVIRTKVSGAPEDSMKLAELLVKQGTAEDIPAGRAYLREPVLETAALSR